MQTHDVGSHQVLMLALAGEIFALDARLIREILDSRARDGRSPARGGSCRAC